MMKKSKNSKTKSSVRVKSKSKPKSGGGGQNKGFFAILNRKRDDILRIVKKKENDITLGEVGDEADTANQNFEREMIFELTNGERIILDDIEAALRKIEKGNYGRCESCQTKITSPRLHAMPWARYCIKCQSRRETPR